MSECPHKELKKQMVGEFVYYVCECGQKFRVEPWDGKVPQLPGADTGTTPPPDVCPECTLGPPNWADRKECYCAFCNDTGSRPQVKPAERGTTPPEGLAFTFEEFIDMSLRHNKRLAAGISGIASFGHWYNEMLAATQRAPVEQGPQQHKIPEYLYEPFTNNEGQPLICSICGSAIPQIDCGWHGDCDRGVFQHIECSYQQTIKELQAKLAAAPDHAREGALPSRGKLLAEASYWHNCAETKPSSFENATQWDILHYCAGIVERALADGKEGEG